MNTRIQLICLWSGYAFCPLYLIGFALFAGFLPIPSPTLDAVQVAALFDQNQTRILIGMTLCVFASALLVPWAVAIFEQMSRIETKSRTLSYVQLCSGTLGPVFFMFPTFTWAAMAFRSGRNPEILLAMDDFAWITWVISYAPYFIQAVTFGLCVLLYKTEQPIIPRWAAYLSIWMGICLVPATLVIFFKTGPFAWDGLITIYIPLAIYTLWFHTMLFVLLKAIKGQTQQAGVTQAGIHQAAY